MGVQISSRLEVIVCDVRRVNRVESMNPVRWYRRVVFSAQEGRTGCQTGVAAAAGAVGWRQGSYNSKIQSKLRGEERLLAGELGNGVAKDVVNAAMRKWDERGI